MTFFEKLPLYFTLQPLFPLDVLDLQNLMGFCFERNGCTVGMKTLGNGIDCYRVTFLTYFTSYTAWERSILVVLFSISLLLV